MESVILVIHLIIALGIIVLVLLQRSEGGGIGLGGGGGGLGGLASARGTANALSKLTALFAVSFFVTSLTLGILAGGHSKKDTNILENVDVNAITIETPAVEAPVSGVTYTPPTAPVSTAPVSQVGTLAPEADVQTPDIPTPDIDIAPMDNVVDSAAETLNTIADDAADDVENTIPTDPQSLE